MKYDYLIPQETISAEFSQFNHAFEGRKYRYGYVVLNPYAAGSQIMKIDMDDPSGRGNKFFKAGPTIAVSEPWFVANPGSREEDDGVLLIRGLDTATKRTPLLVVNAKTMEEAGRAEAHTPVPFGFHNRFYFKKDLGIPDGYKPKSSSAESREPTSPAQPVRPIQPPQQGVMSPRYPNPMGPRPINPGPFQPKPINPVPDGNFGLPSFPQNSVEDRQIPPIPQPPMIPIPNPNQVVVYPPSGIQNNQYGGSSNSNQNNRPTNDRGDNSVDFAQIAQAGKRTICSLFKGLNMDLKNFCNSN